MNTVVMPSLAGLNGLQAVLLWVCIVVGVAGCALIFFVTVRHRLRLLAGTTVVDLPVDTRGAPARTRQAGAVSSSTGGRHDAGGACAAAGSAGVHGVSGSAADALSAGERRAGTSAPHGVHGEVDGYATGPTSLLSEIIWVAVPLVMMLGLGAWVVAQLWQGEVPATAGAPQAVSGQRVPGPSQAVPRSAVLLSMDGKRQDARPGIDRSVR